MARVLVPADAAWYDELRAVGYYSEADLERQIRQHLDSLFPDFHVFPFKSRIVGKTTSIARKPDLAMVRRDFSAWGIIEVELSEHRIAHVLDQVACFADGEYNVLQLAAYLRDQLKLHCGRSVALSRVRQLLKNEPPIVLVIADADIGDWQEELVAQGAQLCVFQMFKNAGGRYVYRVAGDYPVVPAREAHCRRHETISNLVEVIGPFQFKNLGKKRQVDVVFDALITRWAVIEDAGTYYLRFLGKENPLSANATYGLFVDRRNRYYFKVN